MSSGLAPTYSTVGPHTEATSLIGPPQGSSSQPQPTQLLSLKRRISMLEIENAQLFGRIVKKPMYSVTREGRAIRRLVSLSEPVSDMIAEYDRRQHLLTEPGVTVESTTSTATPEQVRTYNNFKKLIECCPTARRIFESGEIDLIAIRELQTGADGARGDDASTLKVEVISWLKVGTPESDPALNPRDKEGRGMNHDETGRLICPVDYDWSDAVVRASMRDYHPEFRVTAHSWPRFLYMGGVFDLSKPSKGLFQGELLVKAFKCIFTSPTSARHDVRRDQNAQYPGPRTRKHVAALLKMKSVDPRAIAYIAAQVRFALSHSTSWAIIEEDFDYEVFYNHIVDYFEAPSSAEKETENKKLLLWWNRIIFGRRYAAEYCPLQHNKLSVAQSRK